MIYCIDISVFHRQNRFAMNHIRQVATQNYFSIFHSTLTHINIRCFYKILYSTKLIHFVFVPCFFFSSLIFLYTFSCLPQPSKPQLVNMWVKKKRTVTEEHTRLEIYIMRPYCKNGESISLFFNYLPKYTRQSQMGNC